jgi:hypothetical protein
MSGGDGGVVTTTSVELGWPAKFSRAKIPIPRQSTFPTSSVIRLLRWTHTLRLVVGTLPYSGRNERTIIRRSKRRPREEVATFRGRKVTHSMQSQNPNFCYSIEEES